MTSSAARKIDDDGQFVVRSALAAEVVERADTSDAWGVEAINTSDDGEIYMAVFYGPDAKDLAVEYAGVKYASFQIR